MSQNIEHLISYSTAGVYEFADSHSCCQLAQSAFTYSVNHFNKVLQTDKFCLISIDHVNKLLSDNALNVPSEERVFEAAIAWIEYDKENRMVCFYLIHDPNMNKECSKSKKKCSTLTQISNY